MSTEYSTTQQTQPAGSEPLTHIPAASPRAWSPLQKVAFRIAFIYIALLVIPSGIFSLPPNFSWFTQWFKYDWTSLHYRDIYDIARYSPSFPLVGKLLGLPRLEGHSIWLILLFISSVLGLIWTALDRKSKEYNQLYYWSLVLARFRAGIGIIGFGFTKFLPTQMPYPSESLLNTDFGDFTGQKIYWLSIGIVPWYQVLRVRWNCLQERCYSSVKQRFMGPHYYSQLWEVSLLSIMFMMAEYRPMPFILSY